MDSRWATRGDVGLSGRWWPLYRRWARLGSLGLRARRRLWGGLLAAHPEVHAVVRLGHAGVVAPCCGRRRRLTER